MASNRSKTSTTWTFLSNHTHVLICIAQQPTIRLRDIAEKVGITERAVQKIVLELEEVGAIQRTKTGRRNNYSINQACPLRHEVERHTNIGAILDLIVERPE